MAISVTQKYIDRNTARLAKTLLDLYNRQRRALPVGEIIRIQRAPLELTKQWEQEFKDWFLNNRTFWERLWNVGIKNIQIKLTSQDLFNAWIISRSGEIGIVLANVNVELIGGVLDTYSHTSVTRLQRHLRENIGLHPRQMNALARQSDKIRSQYPAAQADRIIARLESKKKSYRAKMIARNEMSAATNNAQISDIQNRMNADELPAMEKSWSVIGDDRTSDGCWDNDGDGWIKFHDTFSSGHAAPPRFPGCRCALQFRAALERSRAAA